MKPVCIVCQQPFTSANVFTPLGWKEIHMSGLCERCFDKAFEEEDEESEKGNDEEN